MAEDTQKRGQASLGAGKSSKPKGESKGGGKGKKDKGKKVKGMHLSRTDNGKYLAKHEFEHDPNSGEMRPEDETHALEDMPSLQSHVAEHLGDVQPPEPPAGGGPMATAPPPSPGALRGGM